MNRPKEVAPTITVLMACYNGARWLAEAIDSVLEQTCGDFEFIIVDDGSTDNSPEIIQRFAVQDSRIVVITKPNTGLSDSLNVGIRQARGEWIARLDADDVCEPSRLEKQLAKARENSDLAFIGSGLLIIDENGVALKAYRYPSRHALLVRNLTTLQKFPPHSSAFYRTDAVRSIGGYRNQLRRAQDCDLWLRLSELGQLAAIDEPLVRIRKHSEQISHEESGRRQLIDSRTSIISYWIRRHGFSDPITADGEAFETFSAWVENKLDQKRLFECFDYIARIKMNIAVMYKSPTALLATTKHIVSKPSFLLGFLRARLHGEMTPRQLAIEWMKKSNTCSSVEVFPQSGQNSPNKPR